MVKRFFKWLYHCYRGIMCIAYELIKKYTMDNSAHYIYKLNWSYTDEVKYADARYVSKSTGNGSHTFKRVGLVYSNTEPVPDNVTKYRLEDVQKEKEREDSLDDTPTFIPFFIPIKWWGGLLCVILNFMNFLRNILNLLCWWHYIFWELFG